METGFVDLARHRVTNEYLVLFSIYSQRLLRYSRERALQSTTCSIEAYYYYYYSYFTALAFTELPGLAASGNLPCMHTIMPACPLCGSRVGLLGSASSRGCLCCRRSHSRQRPPGRTRASLPVTLDNANRSDDQDEIHVEFHNKSKSRCINSGKKGAEVQ